MKTTKAQTQMIDILSDGKTRTIFEIARASSKGFGWVDRTLESLESRGIVTRTEIAGELPKFGLAR